MLERKGEDLSCWVGGGGVGRFQGNVRGTCLQFFLATESDHIRDAPNILILILIWHIIMYVS